MFDETIALTGGEQHNENRHLTEDEVFEILSNRRRRFVFHFLKRHRRRVYLRELAEHVAAWENGKSIRELSSAETKRVKTALHQHHLPKMDDEGFVEYDSGRETVVLTDGAADLEVYLDVVPGADVPWSLYYLGVSAFGVLAISLTEFDVGAASLVPDLGIGIGFCVAVLVSAGAHTYFNYSRLRLGSTTRPPEVRK
ncbi:hypothetical protein ACFQFH_04595 [Halobaculum halobium]|uniref:DUF7344 domain-containing protein n=1 Tax=Halobaculum halobium TaxID=3032281 RepID=A0ABD5TB79_9EURY|nr:hypothetical protein [Halobaculum sp. SYNS20]